MNEKKVDEFNKKIKREEAQELFLSLWDKAVGKEGYDKAQWKKFRVLLFDLGVDL